MLEALQGAYRPQHQSDLRARSIIEEPGSANGPNRFSSTRVPTARGHDCLSWFSRPGVSKGGLEPPRSCEHQPLKPELSTMPFS